MSPRPLDGYYPQPRLYGHDGKLPIESISKITNSMISIVKSSP